MNCKPGDLAIVIHPKGAGRLVEVLYEAPVGVEFTLPSGEIAAPTFAGRWVVNLLGSPYEAIFSNALGDIKNKPVTCGVCDDKWLRPISGVPLADEVANEDRVTT